MQLLQSWKESLSIFKPANFKLFLMITIKSVWETFKKLFKYFWWLMLFYILIPWQQRPFPQLIMFSILFFIIFFACLIVRPSVKRKDYSYFFEKIPYIRFVFLFFIPMFFMTFIWLGILSILLEFIALNSFLFSYLLIFPLYFIMVPVATIYTFFILDSEISRDGNFIKKVFKTAGLSFWRTVKMVFYNGPFFIISFLVFYFLIEALFRNKDLIYPLILRSLMLFLIPIILCFYVNFYIKQVHEHFDLYFGKGPSEQEGN